MGDATSGQFRLSFNPQLRVECRGATVTSDAGLLLPRELDERLGLTTLIERHLTDPRTGRNCQFPLSHLFRQSVYSRLAGYSGQSPAPAGSTPCHSELVTHEPAAAGVQDRRAPHPACPVLHPAAGRKPSDAHPLWADPRVHRASRVASDQIERKAYGTTLTRSGVELPGVSLKRGNRGGHTRRTVSQTGNASREGLR